MKERNRGRKDILKSGALGAGGILFIAACISPIGEKAESQPKETTISKERVEDFFEKYNNKYVDYDGFYGTQCVDLVQYYNKEVVGGSFLAGEGAADIWKTYPKDKYKRRENTPEGVPEKGDIVIWDRIPNNKYSYGHIAIFNKGNVHEFTAFAQNRPQGSPSHFQYEQNYHLVLGWLRPKNMEREGDRG